jgi:hypothetical protein
LFAHTQVKRTELDKVKSYFLPGVTAFAFLCPIICASVNNLGYDWRGYSGMQLTQSGWFGACLAQSSRLLFVDCGIYDDGDDGHDG